MIINLSANLQDTYHILSLASLISLKLLLFYAFLRQNHYPVDGSGQDYTRINEISNENSTFKIIFTFETCFPAGVSIAFDFT